MVITLCGSTRFKDEFDRVNRELTLQDHIILMPGIFVHQDENINITKEQKLMLDNLHREKINMSDAIFVINKDKYIGESTFGEIDWARRNKKEIYFLEPVEDEQIELEKKEEVKERHPVGKIL